MKLTFVSALAVACIAALATTASAAPERAPTKGAPQMSQQEVIRTQITPGVRGCYNAALRMDSTLKGRVIINMHVYPKGDVRDVTVIAPAFPPQTLECMKNAASNAWFDSPGSKEVLVTASFNLVP